MPLVTQMLCENRGKYIYPRRLKWTHQCVAEYVDGYAKLSRRHDFVEKYIDKRHKSVRAYDHITLDVWILRRPLITLVAPLSIIWECFYQ